MVRTVPLILWFDFCFCFCFHPTASLMARQISLQATPSHFLPQFLPRRSFPDQSYVHISIHANYCLIVNTIIAIFVVIIMMRYGKHFYPKTWPLAKQLLDPVPFGTILNFLKNPQFLKSDTRSQKCLFCFPKTIFGAQNFCVPT